MKTTLSQNASNSDKRHDSNDDDGNDNDVNDDDGNVNDGNDGNDGNSNGLTQRFFSFSISKFEKKLKLKFK